MSKHILNTDNLLNDFIENSECKRNINSFMEPYVEIESYKKDMPIFTKTTPRKDAVNQFISFLDKYWNESFWASLNENQKEILDEYISTVVDNPMGNNSNYDDSLFEQRTRTTFFILQK
jgi:hypothetical protein